MYKAAVAILFLSLPLASAIVGASLVKLIVIRVLFVALGVWFCAPYHAWAMKLVPDEARYTVLSFGNAIGSQLLGAPTAAIAMAMYEMTAMPSSVAWYWTTLTIAAIIVLRPLKHPRAVPASTA